MRLAGHVARMGERRGVNRLLVGKPEGKRPLGRPGIDGRIILTLRLLMSYIYAAPSKARNANSYIYMDLRLATLKQSLSIF